MAYATPNLGYGIQTNNAYGGIGLGYKSANAYSGNGLDDVIGYNPGQNDSVCPQCGFQMKSQSNPMSNHYKMDYATNAANRYGLASILASSYGKSSSSGAIGSSGGKGGK